MTQGHVTSARACVCVRARSRQPALLTRQSMRPWRSTAAVISLCTFRRTKAVRKTRGEHSGSEPEPGSPGYHPLWKCHMGQRCRIPDLLRLAPPLILSLPHLRRRKEEVHTGLRILHVCVCHVMHLCFSRESQFPKLDSCSH